MPIKKTKFENDILIPYTPPSGSKTDLHHEARSAELPNYHAKIRDFERIVFLIFYQRKKFSIRTPCAYGQCCRWYPGDDEIGKLIALNQEGLVYFFKTRTNFRKKMCSFFQKLKVFKIVKFFTKVDLKTLIGKCGTVWKIYFVVLVLFPSFLELKKSDPWPTATHPPRPPPSANYNVNFFLIESSCAET